MTAAAIISAYDVMSAVRKAKVAHPTRMALNPAVPPAVLPCLNSMLAAVAMASEAVAPKKTDGVPFPPIPMLPNSIPEMLQTSGDTGCL